MIRTLRAIGSFLMAVAILGVVAAPASARIVHDFETESKTAPNIITGEQQEVIVMKMGTEAPPLECEVNGFNATTETESPWESMEVEPIYEGCLLGELAATIDSEECRYQFGGETDQGGHAEVLWFCPPTKSMKITVSGCTIEFPEQQLPSQGAHYKNTGKGTGKGRDIDIEVTYTEMEYVKNGFACNLIAGNGGDLTMYGSYTATAYEDNEGVEGERVGFWTEETVVK